MKKVSIQDEIEKDYVRLVREMDKVFEKQFGKMCPDFESGCAQCSAHLIYNNFKKQLHEAFVKPEPKKVEYKIEYCKCKKPKQEVTTMKGPLTVYCGKCRRTINLK